jgi:hypothetical protein
VRGPRRRRGAPCYGVVFAGATVKGPCQGCAIRYGAAVGAESGCAATSGEATLEIIVEGPFATRKVFPAGDPRGLPAAGVSICTRAWRRRGDGCGPRSGSDAGSYFGKPESPRCPGPPEPGWRPNRVGVWDMARCAFTYIESTAARNLFDSRTLPTPRQRVSSAASPLHHALPQRSDGGEGTVLSQGTGRSGRCCPTGCRQPG